MPRQHRQYDRVAEHDDTEGMGDTNEGHETERMVSEEANNNHNELAPQQPTNQIVLSESGGAKDKEYPIDPLTKTDQEEEDDGQRITVVILDPAHSKFEVSVNPSWNIARMKREGASVHKISASQQRLIYLGRMLADDTILKDAGITEDNTIVHLFPKPRLVLGRNNGGNNGENASRSECEENVENGGDEEEGAHVPRIVLDPDEAQMRSSILVLGSIEVVEAQNNVKLLSFLLLIVCSMELLALFSIMIGAPPDESSASDDDFSLHNPDDDFVRPEVRTWKNSDYFDLVLNMFGLYSAMLGIKATTENTRALARRYLLCTFVCGAVWIIFYYYLNYDLEEKMDEKRVQKYDGEVTPLTPSDLMVQAFFAVLLPSMVWCLCCFRAWRFHDLLREAELEAEQRIRSELNLVEGNNDDGRREESMA